MSSSKDLRDQAYSAIKQMLLSGELEPGRTYTTVEIAELLGMSRTPAREALVCLHVEGYMKEVKKMGFRVPEITLKEVYEVSEALMGVESFVISQIEARELTPDFDALRESVRMQAESAENGDSNTYIRAGCEFHKILVHTLNNSLLDRTYELLKVRTVLLELTAPSSMQEKKAVAEEHRALIGALEAEDYTAAQSNIKLHYSKNIHFR